MSVSHFKITVTGSPNAVVQDYWFSNQQGVFGEQTDHTVRVDAPFGAFLRGEDNGATTSRVGLVNQWTWRQLQHGKLSLDDVVAGRLSLSARPNRAAKLAEMRAAGLSPAASFLLHVAAKHVFVGTRELRLGSAALRAGVADFLRRYPESYATHIAGQAALQLYLEGQDQDYARKTIVAANLVRLLNEAKPQ